MTGTLVVISCSINNDEPIEVDFGSAIGVKKVDGIHYRQSIALNIKCSRAPGDLLNLVFSGPATDFDESLLATTNSNPGIRFLQDETPFAINQPLQVNEDYLPNFFAVPVKKLDAELSSGDFSALAQLQIRLH